MTEPKKPGAEGGSGFSDKLGPLPPESFDNDFPPGKSPPKGKDPVTDALREHVAKHKPPPKK